jgi:hypothetical protein
MSSRRWTGACLQRIQAATPRSPILPPSRVYSALVSVQETAGALLTTSGAIACHSAGATATTGGESIAAHDTRPEDFTSDGLVGQLDPVATVLGHANTRLTRIAAFFGVGPSPLEINAANAVDLLRRRQSKEGGLMLRSRMLCGGI